MNIHLTGEGWAVGGSFEAVGVTTAMGRSLLLRGPEKRKRKLFRAAVPLKIQQRNERGK
jgi:hypothetical protein